MMNRRTASIRCRAGPVQHASQCCYRETTRLHACAAPLCLPLRTGEACANHPAPRFQSGAQRCYWPHRQYDGDRVGVDYPGDVRTPPLKQGFRRWPFHVKQLPLWGPREPCPPKKLRESHTPRGQRLSKREKCWSGAHVTLCRRVQQPAWRDSPVVGRAVVPVPRSLFSSANRRTLAHSNTQQRTVAHTSGVRPDPMHRPRPESDKARQQRIEETAK
jgi:hypothetical protein